MAGHFDTHYVLLSFLIAVLAAWSALDLSARVAVQNSSARRAGWLLAGSFAMGIGIWSMHYIGMLAFRTSMPVLYDWPTVVVSMVAAICSSGVAFVLVSEATLTMSRSVLGGCVMGVGIASMHYIGMAAMRMPAQLTYYHPLVALSVIVAIVISIVALRLTFRVKAEHAVWSWTKAGSALLMGAAIPVMHYIGMTAAHWSEGQGSYTSARLHHSVSVSGLGASGIVFTTILLLAIILVSAGIDRQFLQVDNELHGSNQRNALLSKHQLRVQEAVRAGGVGVWECDPKTGEFYADPGLRVMYNIPPGDGPVPRDLWRTRVHPDDQASLDRLWVESLVNIEKDKYENEYRVYRSEVDLRRYRSVATIVRAEDGTPTRVLGMTWDVTVERQRERDNADLAERFRLTLEAIGDAVISTDHAGNIIFMNRAASENTGWSTEESLGEALTRIFVTHDEVTDLPRRDPIERCIEQGGTLLAEDGVLLGRSGQRRSIRNHVALIEPGRRASVLTFRDITAAREMERELLHAATHDSLTGLLNRGAFQRALESTWTEARKSERRHALCILDLDRFKIINDTSGHLAGDALLREVTELVRANIRTQDIAARMGGDEFLLLLTNTNKEQAELCAERVLASISQLRFPWHGKVYDLTASLGLVIFDHASPEPEVLISQADVAMFASKRAGRNRITAYVEEGRGSAVDHHHEMQVVADLRRSIEHNSFELHAQPIVLASQPTAEPTYFEVLLRMRDEHGQLVSPALFIPAAERYGLMGMVDRWVVGNALALLQQHGENSDLRFAVNLSAESISDPSLWNFVEQQFALTAVDPRRITFEVTETGIIGELTHAKHFMQKARKAGCRIALDDFGTGLSSLSYLKQFPLDVIKIDGGFIKQICDNPLDQAIVKAIAEIAHFMGADTVAECIEDSPTIDLLVGLGVSYLQGYATGRPTSLKAVLADASCGPQKVVEFPHRKWNRRESA